MRRSVAMLSVLSLATMAAALGGCKQFVWKSSGHPALAGDQVRIIAKVPAKYERLGTVSHLYQGGEPWVAGGDGAAVMRDLLNEAGGMGANALLLVDDTTMADSSIVLTYQGKSYTFPVIGKTRTVIAQGVFVLHE